MKGKEKGGEGRKGRGRDGRNFKEVEIPPPLIHAYLLVNGHYTPVDAKDMHCRI